ncbi:MAG: DUF4097 family beta strand repeat-containing protein [Candidatus Saccharimonadales bacterium]
MKTLLSKWWVFVLVFVTAGILLLVTSWGLGAGGSYVYIDRDGIHVEKHGEGERKTISEDSLEEFSSVEAIAVSVDVELIASDHFGFEVQLPSETDGVEWKNEDGKLTIDVQRDWPRQLNLFNLGFFGTDSFVKIYYKEGTEFEDVLLESTSGSVRFDASNEKVKRVQLKVVSGDIRVNNVRWETMLAESVSGGIDVTGEAGTETVVKAVSGDVRLKLGGEKKYAYVATSVSGDINVNGQRMGSPARLDDNGSMDGEIRAATTSGEVRIEF